MSSILPVRGGQSKDYLASSDRPDPLPLTFALRAAAAGRAVFPLEGKAPTTGATPRGVNDASRDPSRIRAMFNKAGGRATGYGIATGAASRLVAVDIDGPGARAEAERLGLESGYVVRTGRAEGDGWHLHLELPEGVEARSRTLAPGLEVKGDGSYVVGPGSKHPSGAVYRVAKDGNPSPTPLWILETPTRDPVPRSRHRGDRPAPVGASGEAGPIADGGRNRTLASIAGRLHDGSRSLDELSAELHNINASRCIPQLPAREVEKIARSIYKTEPCRPSRSHEEDPEVEGLLQGISDRWYEEYMPKSGRSKKPDTLRYCIGSAARRKEARTVEVDGKEERVAVFSDSCRQIAVAVRTSAVSVSNHLQKLEEEGVLVVLERRPGMAPTLGLRTDRAAPLHPRTTSGGGKKPPARDGGVKKRRAPRADELTTPFYGWGSPWRDGGVEAAVEAFGPQGAEELAATFGVSRARDLRRRRLAPLEEMGVLVVEADRWGVPRCHAAAVEGRMRERYTTVTRRRRRKTTSEGRRVVWVDETVTEASEIERAATRIARHDGERDRFRKTRRAGLHRVALECFGVASLNPETGKILEEPEPGEGTTAAEMAERRQRGSGPALRETGDVALPLDGEIRELERLPGDATAVQLLEALSAFLQRNPHRRRERPSWLAVALWADELVGSRPAPADVEAALSWLEAAA